VYRSRNSARKAAHLKIVAGLREIKGLAKAVYAIGILLNDFSSWRREDQRRKSYHAHTPSPRAESRTHWRRCQLAPKQPTTRIPQSSAVFFSGSLCFRRKLSRATSRQGKQHESSEDRAAPPNALPDTRAEPRLARAEMKKSSWTRLVSRLGRHKGEGRAGEAEAGGSSDAPPDFYTRPSTSVGCFSPVVLLLEEMQFSVMSAKPSVVKRTHSATPSTSSRIIECAQGGSERVRVSNASFAPPAVMRIE
jgi:hypothetical protein